MAYPLGAVERAMKVQEVVLRTLDGKLSWLQAADIPGRSPRSIRRLTWNVSGPRSCGQVHGMASIMAGADGGSRWNGCPRDA